MTYHRSEDTNYYLGFDLSTQQLKCLAIDDQLNIIVTVSVDFDKDFPSYSTRKGVYIKEGGTIDAPVAMWLEAIDLCFERMSKEVDLKLVRSMSGSCQQHGTVYWNTDHLPRDLDAQSTLLSELRHVFSRDVAPNWQDHSTKKQCGELADKVGGPVPLAEITGSSAHYRFSGSQIAKIHENEPEVYAATKKISLVSSFLASILVGDIVPLEEADACGMNLFDIKKHAFDSSLLSVVDENIDEIKNKLHDPPTSCREPSSLGSICSYFHQKYGVSPDCQIYPFTGDNLATICSLPLQRNDVLISLGTSTTILLVTDQYHSSPNYHLFIHPTVPNHYMGMICYCNGSLAREKIRDSINGETETHDWTQFNESLSDASLNNDDHVGIYFPLAEIVPNMDAVTKRCHFQYTQDSVDLKEVPQFADSRLDAKNIVESQALSCRVRISPLLSSESLDPHTAVLDSEYEVRFDYDSFPLSSYAKRPNRAFFVGGASKNDSIVKTMANVIGAKNGNYRLETPNSCALGGCYKAMWSLLRESNTIVEPFDQWLNSSFQWERDCEFVCNSDFEQWEYYNKKIRALSALEQHISN